jgi:hypothetical protein
MKFKNVILASDFDGTLKNDLGEITADVRSAIADFMSEGGYFTVCTGRIYQGFHLYDPEYINAPVLLGNGAMAYDYENDDIILNDAIGDEGLSAVNDILMHYPDICIEFYNIDKVCAVNLNEHVVLLGLNDDQNGTNGSGFSEEHFKWIEKTVADAKSEGKLVISMQHHLLIAHIHKLITGGGTSVHDNETVANRMADAGIRYSFVGHSHMLDTAKITSPAGNTLTEVNIGSLCGYPAPIVNVTVNSALNVRMLEEENRLERIILCSCGKLFLNPLALFIAEFTAACCGNADEVEAVDYDMVIRLLLHNFFKSFKCAFLAVI